MLRKRLNIYIILIVALAIFITSPARAVSDRRINVTMNNKKMTVVEVPIIMNDKIVKTDTPSFLYIDRTLVPARLIAENYGAKVGWSKKTETATISYKDKVVELKINSPVVKLNGVEKTLDKYSTPRLVNFGGSSAVTMVPLTFLVEEVLGYETDWDYEKKAAYIKTGESPKEPDSHVINPIDPVGPADPKEPVEVKAKNKVLGASISNNGGKEVLTIQGTNLVKRNLINLKDPNRIVIDLMESELEGSTYKEFDYSLGIIKSIRMSQFIPDENYNQGDKIVRIVLDIKDGVTDPKINISEAGGNLVIEPEESFWDNIDFDSETRVLTVRNEKTTSYTVTYDNKRKEMVLSIPSQAVELEGGSIPISDLLVAGLEIIPRGNTTDVVLRARRGINYNIISANPSKEIGIKITRDQNIKKSDRIIIVDPGHGGTDPGTSSAKGTREKDLVLSTGLKVRDKLKSLGYNVIMTRDKDVFITLDERPEIGNRNFADVFVSIHGNSASSSASGIETYVPRTVPDEIKKEQGKALAKLIQDELIKETKAKNRGVKEANHAVTRKSNMAAVLIEIGFLTNPNEEALLKSDAYQEKLANAIVRGIERYFEIY